MIELESPETAPAVGLPATTVGDPAWVDPLAELLVEDGVERRPATTLAQGRRRARRYAAFLSALEVPHVAETCPVCTKASVWPGEFFFHVGKPTVLVAPQGHGKTNSACFLAELGLFHHRDWDLFTNVPFPWTEDLEGVVPAPEHLHRVKDSIELVEGFARTLKAGRKPAAVLDECGQWLSSHDWQSEGAESWTKFTYLERHFRTRGPILVYHTWKTVLEPFRREGDLRGSYCKVVRAPGSYRIARAEDRSSWWRLEESALPFLTLGQGGFEPNLDFKALLARLSGSHKRAADQTLEYLAEVREQQRLEAETAAAEARLVREEALASRDLGVAELHRAHEARREEIIRAFMDDPELTNRAAQKRFRASAQYLVDCRRVALSRLAAGRPGFPVSKEPT